MEQIQTRINVLLSRANFLLRKIRGKPLGTTFDKNELSALAWMVNLLHDEHPEYFNDALKNRVTLLNLDFQTLREDLKRAQEEHGYDPNVQRIADRWS